jgi:hypothetical protein
MTYLLHDGELGQVRELLRDLGAAFVERLGDPVDVDRRTEWDLIIANQQRISGLRMKASGPKPTRIAIVDSDSRTLRAMLRRYGIDYVVARPVHAAALRLLLLHCLYRGPEKRRQARVSIGAPVQCRSGLLRRFSAILTDLSQHGCRLAASEPVSPGKRVRISAQVLAPDGKPLNLWAGVLRCSSKAQDGGEYAVAMKFEKLSPKVAERVRKTLELYARGPAKLEHAIVAPPGDSQDAATQDWGEQRTSPRHEYGKRVVALGEEAARVLVCRDISLGGMRVEPNPSLATGDALKLAIHVSSRGEPLVVDARVEHDDNERGLVIGFGKLGSESERYLRQLLSNLPVLEAGGGEGERRDAGLVVSEIIDRRAN